MPHETELLTRGRYKTIAAVAVLVAVGCFALVAVTSLGLLSELRIAGTSLWPLVMVILIGSNFVAFWALAKSKGGSGWLGVFLSFLDLFGLATLDRLEDRSKKVPDHEA